MADLTTKTARNRLPKRREPHWMRLQKFCHLGFRRGPDTWIARHTRREADGRYRYEYSPLGAADFDTAKEAAEKWFEWLGSYDGVATCRGTVRAALETYIEVLREQGREATADNAEDRFRLIVWDDPIADIRLAELTRQDFRKWRERLRSGRQNRSVNRHVRSMVAGLNCAVREGHMGNTYAWQIEPLADDAEVGGESTLFLDQGQRDAIVNAASPACADFLRAIEYTGGRPGELAAATVADLDKGNGTLILRHKKGRPARLRPRAVELDRDAFPFFKQQSRGKLPNAALLASPNGDAWNRYKWADEIQAAIAKVNTTAKGKKRIPKGASAYSFRHARISEMLQVDRRDPVTVAHQTGTSVRMIEEHYYKFIATPLRERMGIEARD